MTERDPSLDLALRLLVAEQAPEDDARWAKRTAAGISNWTAKAVPRAELDALLAAPFPDAHEDAAASGDAAADEDLEEIEAEGDSAASATEHESQADRGYSISHPPTSKSGVPMSSSSPPTGLEGLARLTRSGENSARIVTSPAGDDVGKAKGEDSGLIDLRSMSEKPPAAEEVPATSGVVSAPAAAAPPIARPIVAGAPGAPPSSAIAPPSTMAAQVASAPVAASGRAVAAAPQKKGGNVVWITLGGLAAAAAVGVFAMSSMSSKKPDTASTAQATPTSDNEAKNEKASDEAADKMKEKEGDPVAMASTAPTEPTVANADDSASAAPDDTVAVAPTGGFYGKKALPSGTGNGAPTPTNTASLTTKPTAKASATVEPPKPNASNGGSLDDVLGINKPPPPPTATANTPDLPDKPESADIRVAVNSKVGAANACVKGLDGPSSVSIGFSPAGTVASVSVTSGPAKGTGAEACIKSAFSGVKVPRSKLGGTGYAKLLP